MFGSVFVFDLFCFVLFLQIKWVKIISDIVKDKIDVIYFDVGFKHPFGLYDGFSTRFFLFITTCIYFCIGKICSSTQILSMVDWGGFPRTAVRTFASMSFGCPLKRISCPNLVFCSSSSLLSSFCFFPSIAFLLFFIAFISLYLSIVFTPFTNFFAVYSNTIVYSILQLSLDCLGGNFKW